jgi:hypothetical protein
VADTIVLSRWRARCSRAAETGSGLPWCWRRRRRYAPGLMRAVVWAAGARSVLEVQVAIVTGSLFYVPAWADGIDLAQKWLAEEVARG